MPKGDEVKRLYNHSGRHGVFKGGSSVTAGDRREARRTTATIAAREAIGAKTADDVYNIIGNNPDMAHLFDKVFQENFQG
ncbi:MAG: hypothetical protein WCV58_01710 [Patescibacteria group bacterium]|jgi:hypothetical protein